MAVVGSARGTRPSATPGWVAGLIGGLVLLWLAVAALTPTGVAWIQAAFIVFASLVVQATPFVLIGALASAAVEVFVPIGTLERLGNLPRAMQLPAAALAGMAFPICECGSVPVARRLMLKGLMPSAAIAFMLAAPVVNPVVIASTYIAYRGRGPVTLMVGGRFALGLIVAISVGWVLGRHRADAILRSSRRRHHHTHDTVALGRPEPRWRTFFVHMGNDFLFMGRYLLLGATVAAVFQTFLPQSVTGAAAVLPIVGILVMMGLAFILSLCSESDAFIAASFTQFGASGQLAFLVFGPMIDLKLTAMYAGTFRPFVVRSILVGAGVVTIAGALWVAVIAG